MCAFNKKQEKNNKAIHHWPLYLVAVFFILADLAAATYLIFEEYYVNKIFPGVSIGQIYLGGKTADEARVILDNKINDLNQAGIEFSYNENDATITPIIASFNGDLAYQVITFDVDNTISRAMSIGRGAGIYSDLKNQLQALLSERQIPFSFSADADQIKRILGDNFDQFAAPAKDAKLFATTTLLFGEKKLSLGISPEKTGYQFDYDQAVLAMNNELATLDNSPITIVPVYGQPDVSQDELLPFKAAAQQFLDKAALTLIYGNKKWPIDVDEFAGWLTTSRATDSQISLDLDESKIASWLKEKASPQIEIPPANARFQIQNDRVVEFNQSQNGKRIDVDQTYHNLKNDFLFGGKNMVTIAVATITSEAADQDANNLGITEIVGTGQSDFSRSPKNRIHNITVGAAALNGLLIPPGAEFSTDKALGEVDASTGYLPEMTIMGDKTVPQEGGGLCQIGTTMFRAALASGFPITARQAHSYRVVYYEPAGTDATIYQPWPDLRFINDSPNYLLIQSRIVGNILYFDLWGTKDGRVVEETAPTIYNIVKPPPTKYTETLDLPPGQKKCTELAHNGADAFFDYKVTYPDGTVKQKRFSSHYVPWRQVCLIGVETLSATSTPTAVK